MRMIHHTASHIRNRKCRTAAPTTRSRTALGPRPGLPRTDARCTTSLRSLAVRLPRTNVQTHMVIHHMMTYSETHAHPSADTDCCRLHISYDNGDSRDDDNKHCGFLEGSVSEHSSRTCATAWVAGPARVGKELPSRNGDYVMTPGMDPGNRGKGGVAQKKMQGHLIGCDWRPKRFAHNRNATHSELADAAGAHTRSRSRRVIQESKPLGSSGSDPDEQKPACTSPSQHGQRQHMSNLRSSK